MLTVCLLLVSISRDSGTLFTGCMPTENTHSGEAFNPCPLAAPALPDFPLYMDMFCIRSSFLLAALSAAQQGTNSLLIGTYLGKGRNPIFLNNPYSLPLPSCTCNKLSSFSVIPILLFYCWVIPHSTVPPSKMDISEENRWRINLWVAFQIQPCSSKKKLVL